MTKSYTAYFYSDVEYASAPASKHPTRKRR